MLVFLPNQTHICVRKTILLTVNDDLRLGFVGVADARVLAGVGDLGVLDDQLALAAVLDDLHPFVGHHFFIVFEPLDVAGGVVQFAG